VDRGVVSPGLSGTTTTTEHHGGGAAPAHCLLADRVGGVAKGREHMILRVIWWGSCELAECAERWRRQVGRRRRISVWPPSGGVNGMCVWRVGEHELCFSDVGGSCGVVDHRVFGHFNWVRVFARITASVVLVSHSGASRAQRATSSSRQVVAVRRDPDILQADPRWGYDSGGGSVVESPLVAGW